MHIAISNRSGKWRSIAELRVAIDRFTGEVIDQKLEAVYE